MLNRLFSYVYQVYQILSFCIGVKHKDQFKTKILIYGANDNVLDKNLFYWLKFWKIISYVTLLLHLRHEWTNSYFWY